MSAPARRTDPGRLVIGAVERVAIPAWRLEGIEARVDTGARTSALHVEALSELGQGRVTFALPRSRAKPRMIAATVSRRGRVRSTSGKLETRVFVSVRVRLGETEHRIELGLVDRSQMTYPMLLGRSALAGKFLVDPGRKFLLG